MALPFEQSAGEGKKLLAKCEVRLGVRRQDVDWAALARMASSPAYPKRKSIETYSFPEPRTWKKAELLHVFESLKKAKLLLVKDFAIFHFIFGKPNFGW